MAKYYSVTKLKRFPKNLARLYLLCYVHERLFKVNDHLLTFITYRVNKFYQEAEQWAIEEINRKDEGTIHELVKAEKLIRLYTNKKISDEDLRLNAFQIVPDEEINQFAKNLTAIEEKSVKIIIRRM